MPATQGYCACTVHEHIVPKPSTAAGQDNPRAMAHAPSRARDATRGLADDEALLIFKPVRIWHHRDNWEDSGRPAGALAGNSVFVC